jgi:hypothetical protein
VGELCKIISDFFVWYALFTKNYYNFHSAHTADFIWGMFRKANEIPCEKSISLAFLKKPHVSYVAYAEQNL